MGLHGKKMGFGDYTPFEFGITEIRFEFGITGFPLVPIWDYSSIQNWDYGITYAMDPVTWQMDAYCPTAHLGTGHNLQPHQNSQ